MNSNNNAQTNNSNSNNNNQINNNALSLLPTFTTTGPCEYQRGASIYIPGLSLLYDGGRVLFQPPSAGQGGGDISLLHGRVTGLVGSNGCGKSSFAKLLASSSSSSEGSNGGGLLGSSSSPLRIEYLPTAGDEEESSSSTTTNETNYMMMLPKEYIRARIENRINDVRQNIETLERRLSSSSDSDSLETVVEEVSELYELEERMTAKIEREIDTAMNETGFHAKSSPSSSTNHATKPLYQLSCGWRYKCRLIASMLLHPDVLILDEPGFLDEQSTNWFIDTIRNVTTRVENTCVLLISHKEQLLNAVECDRIMYINSGNQTVSMYPCGYSEFQTRLQCEMDRAKKIVDDREQQHDKATKQLRSLQSSMKTSSKRLRNKYSELNAKGAVGKVTKTSACLGRSDKCQRAEKSAASKLRRTKQAMEDVTNIIEKTKRRDRMKPLVIEGIPSSDQTILNLQSVGFRYNADNDDNVTTWVFRNVDTTLESNDRVLLQGPNGSGKSTLIRLIIGDDEPSSSTSLESSVCFQPTEGTLKRNTENILYFPQTALHDLLRTYGNYSPVDFLVQASSSHKTTKLTPSQARNHLARMGLSKDLALRKIRTLSAGQRVRLWISNKLVRHPNPSLLVLDEATENVDTETKQSLIDLITTFKGAVLVVSHDPDFIIVSSEGQQQSDFSSGSSLFTKTWSLNGSNGIQETFF